MAQSNRKQTMERLQKRTSGSARKRREQNAPEQVQRQYLFGDLSFLFALTIAFIVMAYINGSTLAAIYANPERSILLRVFIAAVFQFGMAGMAALFVIFHRYETLEMHGLTKERALESVGLSVCCFLPVLAVRLVRGGFSYEPFKYVPLMKEIGAAGSPNAEFGMALVFLVWGLIQGFAFIVFADKLDQWKIMRTHNPLLSPSALIVSLIFVLTVSIGQTSAAGWPERIAAFLMMYGLILVKRRTGSAAGTVVTFLLLWNMI